MKSLHRAIAATTSTGTGTAAAAAAVVTALVAGCASPGQLPAHPVVVDGGALVGHRTGAGNDAPTAWPAADWYRDFADPRLDALIDEALAATPSLQTVNARADRAAAEARTARASLWPQVGLDGTSTRQRFTENGLIPPPYAGSMQTHNNVQLSGSWELDLFGRHRAELDAAIGSARAADADAQAARIQLSTQIARGWYTLARLLEQQRTLVAIREQRRQTVGLVRNRVASGLDTTVELRQAENQAFEVDRDLVALDEQISNTRHGLAALAGKGPEALAAASPQWREARTLPWPGEVPADLLGRRADLVAARLRVEAALRDVDGARTLFYPNISLTAFVGLTALGFSEWIDRGSRTYGAGPAIRLPIFDADRLRSNLRSRSADADAAIGTYNGALVDASATSPTS
jgi:NodT family efflux transporter outer membrane factor (OMF) lipoprotein